MEQDSFVWGTALTEQEFDRWKVLHDLTKPWIAWCSLKKKQQLVTPRPYEPTSDEFMELEILSMRAWNML
jgi:hypothetical protein